MLYLFCADFVLLRKKPQKVRSFREVAFCGIFLSVFGYSGAQGRLINTPNTEFTEETALTIYDYGFTPDMLPDTLHAAPARVILVNRDRYKIAGDFGEAYAVLKSSAYRTGEQELPTAGDFVLAEINDSGDSRILQTLPRKTCFSRRDPDPQKFEQAVSANFDFVFIMQSLNQDFNIRRLERYLALSERSGAKSIILLTKSDLCPNPEEKIAEIRSFAKDTPVHAVSVKAGLGLSALNEYLLPRKTIVFLGSSGVGKSSLVNALMGHDAMQVNGIREDDGKGRHTTTHRELLMLKNGAMLIDTPGMRQLGMWQASEGLSSAFEDVEAFLGKCRFSDCRHQAEPGCAVKKAIADGLLSEKRFESYLSLKAETAFSESKEAYLLRKKRFMKAISKSSKKAKKRFDE